MGASDRERRVLHPDGTRCKGRFGEWACVMSRNVSVAKGDTVLTWTLLLRAGREWPGAGVAVVSAGPSRHVSQDRAMSCHPLFRARDPLGATCPAHFLACGRPQQRVLSAINSEHPFSSPGEGVLTYNLLLW